MTVLIRNPSSNPITLPFPFRGVLPAGGAVPISLTLAQVRTALGDLASSLELDEVQSNDGNPFARGLHTAIVSEPGPTRLVSAADAFAQIRCAQACSITIPPDLPFEPGVTAILFTQLHASGQVILVAGAGVTLNTSQTLKSLKQFSSVLASYVGPNEWDVNGEREAGA